MSGSPEPVDLIVRGSHLVTMNAARDVIRDGAVAVRDGVIVAAGKAVDVERDFTAVRTIGGDRFVVTPGMVNTHIHITGEPMTRGYVPDDTPFEENVFQWLCPLLRALDALDERTSGQLAAARDAALGHHDVPRGRHDPLPRRRRRRPARDRHPGPGRQLGVGPAARAERSTAAPPTGRSALLQPQLDDLPSAPDTLVSAWSTLVGHTTCSDPLWRAAKALADEHGVGMSFHMSPGQERCRRLHRRVRPAADGAPRRDRRAGPQRRDHPRVHVDDVEIGLLAERGVSVAHCPTTALKVSYGVTQIGKFPEMVRRGVNVSIGTDGNNASNYSDLMRATYLVAGLFKDARMDPQMFPAETAYEMATLGGSAHDAARRPDRVAGGRQAGRHRAPRRRPARVAPVAQRRQPARVVGRRPRRAHGPRRRPHRRRGRPLHDDRRGQALEPTPSSAARR